MKTNTRDSAGFTLIELLVAISVLALMTVLGWRGLDGITRARLTLNRELEQARSMQLTVSQLQNDCRQLASPALIGNRATLLIKENRLMLLRTVRREGLPTGLQIVDYRLADGALLRWESSPTRTLTELDSLWQALLPDSGSSVQASQSVRLQEHVGRMQIRLWNRAAGAWQSASSVRPAAATAGWSGLELSLQTDAVSSPATNTMVKTFLLGGA